MSYNVVSPNLLNRLQVEGVPNAKTGDKGGAAGRAGTGLAHEALSGFPLVNLKLVHSTIIAVTHANLFAFCSSTSTVL